MNEAKYLKGECQKCGGHLEFPAETIGMEVQCPHCGEQTELNLMTPVHEPWLPRRVIIWTAIAVLILIVGLVGTLMALTRARQLLAKQRPQPPVQISTDASEQGTLTNEFHISAIRLESVQGSSLVCAVGTLKNDSSRLRFGVRVDLDLFDKGGTKSGTARDYRQTLEPGAEWQFRALVNSTNASTARLISVREDQ